MALAGHEQALQQELAREAFLMVNAQTLAEFAKYQTVLKKRIPEWEQAYHLLQSRQYVEEELLHASYSQMVQGFFTQTQPHFEQMLNSLQKLSEVSFDQEDNRSLVNQMLYQKLNFSHSLNMMAKAYEQESEGKYNQLRLLELMFFGLTITIIILQIIFLFKPALTFIHRTFDLLKNKERSIFKSEQQIKQQLEELRVSEQSLQISKAELKATNAQMQEINERLQKANDELEDMHLYEREHRMMAELAQKESQTHKEEFQLSYQELKATEQELRHYTEALETLNKQLADANVTAVELQIELEDTLVREQEYSKELKDAYKILKQTQSKLIHAEKMASLGQLVGGIAHELNNPMNFVSGGAQGMLIILEDIEGLLGLLEEIKQIKDHTGEYGNQLKVLAEAYNELDWETTKKDLVQLAANINTGVKRSNAIVKSLHSFARTDSESYGILHLSSSIDDIWNVLGDKQIQNITLVKEYHSTPTLECNARGVHQVLMHLFNNAVDALQAIPGLEGIIKVTIWEEAGVAYLKIADNGAGISEKVAPKIFEPFFTTKDVGEGMGLGLSISYTILQEHNGNIELSREEEGWTTFIISLPITLYQTEEEESDQMSL